MRSLRLARRGSIMMIVATIAFGFLLLFAAILWVGEREAYEPTRPEIGIDAWTYRTHTALTGLLRTPIIMDVNGDTTLDHVTLSEAIILAPKTGADLTGQVRSRMPDTALFELIIVYPDGTEKVIQSADAERLWPGALAQIRTDLPRAEILLPGKGGTINVGLQMADGNVLQRLQDSEAPFPRGEIQ